MAVIMNIGARMFFKDRFLASHFLLLVLLGGLVFFAANSASGDDSAVEAVGGTIRPMDEHPTVRLLAEFIHARISEKRDKISVECIFILHNAGRATLS